jgi:hypothetical protein
MPAGQFVEKVTLRGLTFAHTEWCFPDGFSAGNESPTVWPPVRPEVGGFAQAAVGVPGGVWNVYFDARANAQPTATRFANATLEQWHARAHDAHSLIADPLFVAPKQYDFRLRPDSPALQLGFEPIDLSHVGPPQNSQNSSAPIPSCN